MNIKVYYQIGGLKYNVIFNKNISLVDAHTYLSLINKNYLIDRIEFTTSEANN